MKRGFTLIEVLVASLLLGMLITILTMVFNSSSVAWRVGKAGVSELIKTRRQLSVTQKAADDAIPRVNGKSVSEMGLVVGAWQFGRSQDNGLRSRAILVQNSSGSEFSSGEKQRLPYAQGKFGNLNQTLASSRKQWQSVSGFDKADMTGGKSYTVGVWSYGPDGIENTEDDINSWPEDMTK